MKIIRTVVMRTGIAAIVMGFAVVTAAEDMHTNVVLIMADDIGYECYGCNGSEFYQTPNIDQLAANGARFTHAYSQPLCTPSRVKIMTGKHNFRNYVRFGTMDLSQKTFAHAVKEAPSDLDGQNMLPLMKGDDSRARGWAFVDYSRGGTPPYRHFIRTRRYKLYSDGKLYDIPNDWMEQKPLTGPTAQEIRQHLRPILDVILKDHPTADEIRRRQAEKIEANQHAVENQNGKKK